MQVTRLFALEHTADVKLYRIIIYVDVNLLVFWIGFPFPVAILVDSLIILVILIDSVIVLVFLTIFLLRLLNDSKIQVASIVFAR